MKMGAKKWACVAAAALLALAGIVSAFYLSAPRAALWEEMSMAATATGEHGVAPETAFALTFARGAKEEELRAMLATEPELSYALSGGGKEWMLTPEEPLSKNTVYTFRVRDAENAIVRSFAFQTQTGLLVNDMYPRDGSSWADVNTGIELSFNTENVDMQQHFQIEPAVKGSFLLRGNSSVFVPDEPLTQDSVYRVTLKAGLTAPSGVALEQDVTFSFQTVGDEDEYLHRLSLYGDFAEAFLPGDPIVVRAEGGKYIQDTDLDVTVHRLADVETYAKLLQERDNYYKTRTGPRKEFVVSTEALEETLRAQLKLTHNDYFGFFTLPQELPEGCYVITAQGVDGTGMEQFLQKLVQVTNLSAFTQSSNGKTVIWLNNAADGKPVASADVEAREKNERRTQKTDENGAAVLPTDEMGEAWLTVSQNGKMTYFSTLETDVKREAALYERYFSALYKDREIFRPTDTMKLWGVLRPRGAETPPTQVQVQMKSWADDVLYKQNVAIAPDGTFTAELSFTGLEQNYYYINITDGTDSTYASTSVTVGEFTKPPLVMDVAADKKWYFANEEMAFSASAAYYDGTPAAGGKLDIFGGGLAERDSVITLDAQGKGAYKSRIQLDEAYGWEPQRVHYSVTSGDSIEVYTEASGTAEVLPSRYAFEVQATEDGQAVLRAAAFNTAAMEQPWSWEKTAFGRYAGAQASLDVTVEIWKTVRHRYEDGSDYDEINKVNVPRYRYESEDILVETRQVRINGTTTIDLGDAWRNPTEDERYWGMVKFEGGYGYTIEQRFSAWQKPYYYQRGVQYGFAPQDGESRFAVDEAVPLGLYLGEKPVENKGRVLYTVVQQEMGTPAFFAGAGTEVTFSEALIPGFYVAGAYFDGRHTVEMQPFYVSYDYTERTLEVLAAAQQESYAPGDEAVLTVTLKDALGNPVAGSACIGVVDESIFDVEQQEIDIAREYYSYVSMAPVWAKSSYRSYAALMDNADAPMEGSAPDAGTGGGGGGGGVTVRESFADTAAFEVVQVDASGTAQVKLTLPDNVTKWRITAVAVTPDGKLGTGVGKAITTLPFYVRAVVTDTYVAGDDITAGVLAVGTQLGLETPVEYKAVLLDAQGKELLTKAWSAPAGTQTYVGLGANEKGSYRLRVEAQGGGLADALELPFTVADVGATARVTQRMELSELPGVEAQRWPIVVRVFDKNLETYMKGLRALGGGWGQRTEILAAAHEAQLLQNELLPKDERPAVPKDPRLSDMQEYDGGARPLPNAQPDAALTAKLLLTAPDLLNRGFAGTFLHSVQTAPEATRESRVMAYVGLAALHEPVLLDVRYQLTLEGLTTSERLYLGAALASLGDYEGAGAVYEACAGERRQDEAGNVYFEGADENERLKNTGAALTLCSIAGHSDAEALMKYLLADLESQPHKGQNVLVELDMLSYVRYFRFNVGQGGIFEYREDGKRRRVPLGAHGVQTLVLTAEDFAQANIKAVRGELAAEATYWGRAELPEKDGVATVEKTVTPLLDSLKAPGMARVEIKVTFAEDAPYGAYALYDRIPSGMRWTDYGSRDYGWDSHRPIGWLNVPWNEGQQVRGLVYYAEPEGPMPLDERENPSVEANPVTDEVDGDPRVFTLTYYVNCPLPGTYVLEQAYLVDTAGKPTAASPRGEVTIAGENVN